MSGHSLMAMQLRDICLDIYLSRNQELQYAASLAKDANTVVKKYIISYFHKGEQFTFCIYQKENMCPKMLKNSSFLFLSTPKLSTCVPIERSFALNHMLHVFNQEDKHFSRIVESCCQSSALSNGLFEKCTLHSILYWFI